MLVKNFHWLEITEFVCIGAAVIGAVIVIATKTPILPLIFLPIALILNVINRLRWQYFSRKRLSGSIKQLQSQISEEIQSLKEKQATPPTPTKPSEINQDVLIAFRETLVTLEQSLNHVVQYLNTHLLLERVEQLETSYNQLKEEFNYLSNQLISTEPEILPLPSPDPLPESEDRLMRVVNLPSVSVTSTLPTTPSWDCLYTLKQHQEVVSALSLSADGRFLASASWDQRLILWEMATGKLLTKKTAHSQGLLTVVFTASGAELSDNRLATGSFDQTIKLWSVALDEGGNWELNLNHTLTNHTGSVHALAISPNPNLLISGSYDQTVKQWHPLTGEMRFSVYDPLGAIYAIAIHRGRELIASAGGDGRVSLWKLGSNEKICLLAGNLSSVESLAISPDGEILAAGCVDGSIKLWQLEASRLSAKQSLNPIRTLAAHGGHVKYLLFSQADQTLFSCGADGTIKIWHPSSDLPITTLNFNDSTQSRRSAVLSLALSFDAQFLAAGSADGTIKIWQTN